MSKIQSVHAHEILDSRGNPTLSVSVLLESGAIGSASVPSGASTGDHEALELRDHDTKRYGGLGVKKAVRHVNTKIRERLIGIRAAHQQEIDLAMIDLDGTQNKSKLGANAILGASLACARASANDQKKPLFVYLRETFEFKHASYRLPRPTMNIMNGGAHAAWVLDVQEFMIVPAQKTMRERVRCGAEVFHTLGRLLREKKHSTGVGDEGGYAVSLKKNEEALKLIMQAITVAGYTPGRDVGLAMDPAASEWYQAKEQAYYWPHEDRWFTGKQLIAFWKKWLEKYPFVSIEDPLDQDDWEGWTQMTKQVGGHMTIVGDDFLVTNADRLRRAIEEKAGNAILIKLNQIGTLTETMEAIQVAQQCGYKVSVSHRSGETADTFIADLAVAVNADFIKTGSLSRSERVEKYNRLMEIEEELNWRV